jgi:SAM-dependent methyltransferase
MTEDTTTKRTPTDRSDQLFGGTDDPQTPVDRDELRDEVRAKYAAVATDPEAEYHFHTGRVIAERCRYDMDVVDRLPAEAVESFAGVANPFELRPLRRGERVVDLGSGAGMDSFLASRAVGETGYVIGVDMTHSMLAKSRATAEDMGLANVEFLDAYVEDVPVEDGWADVVISNGVINLTPDKIATFREIWRVLKSGGILQFADIANGRPVPEEARRHIDLWTG